MIAPGTVLQNRYLVERQIGAGGMGAVYIATDQRFGSTVALKETFFDDPNLRRAFEREAKLLNHLRHSALPRVSDHFSEGEGQFLVMEYMPGEDLSNMLKARAAPFAVRDVLSWADQLLDALEYLHTQTQPVVHRDIKPQNLKLLPRNQIVLLDFGLAKGTPLQTRITTTGSVFGYSFNYAPIEQMQGTGTDPRSDLYSLAATLYHLLTYATPPDALTRATALVNGDPDPLRRANELNPRVPSEVADVLVRALQQSAARRFSSAEEMRGSLREAASFVGEEALDGASVAATMMDAIASPTAMASEQATQMMQGEGGGATSPLAKGTEAVSSQDAATLLSAAVAGGASAANSTKETPSAKMSAAQTSSGAKRADDSVVTRVKTIESDPAPRGNSRRMLGFAAGVVIVALVGAVAYSLANRGAQTSPAAQPTPQPVAQPATASPQPTAENQQAAAPSPTQQAKPAATNAEQPRPAPTAKNEKPQEARPPAPEARPPAPPAHAPAPDADAEDDAEADAIFRNRDWANNPPSDEELRRWSEQHPRRARMLREKVREEKRRAMEEQRRAMDEQRRNDGGDTRPPARRPPGRRRQP